MTYCDDRSCPSDPNPLSQFNLVIGLNEQNNMIHQEESNQEAAAAAFDPTDTKYQVSDDFPPDRESTWPYPPEKSGWVIAHNYLRDSMNQFQECLISVRDNSSKINLQEWQVDCIRELFTLHYDMVEEHHTTEDKVLAPEFLKRFKYPEKLVDDHGGIIEQLDRVSDIVRDLKPGGADAIAIASVDKLIAEFETYSNAMRAHFQEEEAIGLPLSRAYFRPDEFAKIMKRGHSGSKKKSQVLGIGCWVYFHGTDNVRKFMKQEGIPFFVWYLVYLPGYKQYCREILPKVSALIDGVEPLLEKRRSFLCFF